MLSKSSAAIEKLWKQGKTPKEIQSNLNISMQTIMDWLNRDLPKSSPLHNPLKEKNNF